jgi:hypothetical protein
MRSNQIKPKSNGKIVGRSDMMDSDSNSDSSSDDDYGDDAEEMWLETDEVDEVKSAPLEVKTEITDLITDTVYLKR